MYLNLKDRIGNTADLACVCESELYYGHITLIYSKKLTEFQSFRSDETIRETMIKINRIYDRVEAETRKSQARFQII